MDEQDNLGQQQPFGTPEAEGVHGGETRSNSDALASGQEQSDPSPVQPGNSWSAAPEDPPVVMHKVRQLPPPTSEMGDIVSWLDHTLGKESYGAPRVFDLFTLLAVTLAFATMFMALRWLAPAMNASLPACTMALGSFVTLTAIAQLALWNGEKPRLASVVAGPVVWMITAIGMLLPNPRVFLVPETLLGVICSSFIGIAAGYLAGAMVAGVFLLADAFRKRFLSGNSSAPEPENDDHIWND